MPLSPEEIRKVYYEDENHSMGFFQKIKVILAHPRQFFSDIKNEKGIKSPLVFYLIFYALANLIYLTALQSIGPSPFINIEYNAGYEFYIRLTIQIIAGIIVLFSYSFITHIFAKLFKGNGGYSDTFRAFAYSPTPMFIFGTIIMIFTLLLAFISPTFFFYISAILTFIVVLAISLWSLWLEYKILSATQGISEWKAFFSIILPAIMIFIILKIIIEPYTAFEIGI